MKGSLLLDKEDLPGARIADLIEDAIKSVADIRFVISSSRENVSSILVRFRDVSERVFDKRVNDLRREIQNKAQAELPEEVREDPRVLEITTSNGFPTAQVLVSGLADDETLRRVAREIRLDLERLAGVDQVFALGLHDAELRVEFDPRRLAARGLTGADLADAVRGWFRDTFAGKARAGDEAWLVRVIGQDAEPGYLANLTVAVPGSQLRVPLEEVARAERARATPRHLASSGGRPAVLLSVTKKAYPNTLQLVEAIRGYVAEKNPQLAASGLRLALTDDQTVPTRQAISIMESNALLGLALVLALCWVFLGTRGSLLVALGIPFSLAGGFAVLHAAGVTLNIRHGRDLPFVKVDQVQLEQVVINLAVNARDAMDGAGELDISTKLAEIGDTVGTPLEPMPAGAYVQIDIADRGVGIEPEHLERIFEPFFTTKPLGEGTGLGLSTVYGIVKQTGGFIFVSSRVGEGTTFSLYLPPHVDADAKATLEAAERPRDLTGAGTIMLVEDEDPVRLFGARALRGKGYRVIEASTGEAALRLFEGGEANDVDLLGTDIVMPELDGPSLIAAAR